MQQGQATCNQSLLRVTSAYSGARGLLTWFAMTINTRELRTNHPSLHRRYSLPSADCRGKLRLIADRDIAHAGFLIWRLSGEYLQDFFDRSELFFYCEKTCLLPHQLTTAAPSTTHGLRHSLSKSDMPHKAARATLPLAGHISRLQTVSWANKGLRRPEKPQQIFKYQTKYCKYCYPKKFRITLV